MTAAQEWRNKEETEQQGRGTHRRRRPGVVFDVGEEVEDGPGPMQKTMRQNLQSMQAQMAQAHAQGQAQGQAQGHAQAQAVHAQAHPHAQMPMPARQATA